MHRFLKVYYFIRLTRCAHFAAFDHPLTCIARCSLVQWMKVLLLHIHLISHLTALVAVQSGLSSDLSEKRFLICSVLPFWPPRCFDLEIDYLCEWEIAMCVVSVPLLTLCLCAAKLL